MIGETAGRIAAFACAGVWRRRARSARPPRLRCRRGEPRVDGLDLIGAQGRSGRPVRPARRRLHRSSARHLWRLARQARGHDPGRRRGSRRSPSPDEAVALGLGLMAQDRRDCLIARPVGRRQYRHRQPRQDRPPRHARRRGRRGAGRSTRSTPLKIKAASIDVEVRTLSGGNQQKVQIARWLAADTRILIMIDPTRGVDVGARREIKRDLVRARQQGHAHPACLDRCRGTCRRLRPGHRDEPRPPGRRSFPAPN